MTVDGHVYCPSVSTVTVVIDPDYIFSNVNLVFLTSFIKPKISLRVSTLSLVL